MKATGIVRRIDELGRIVIPKEIRRNFKLKEGTPLEIFCGDENELVLKKYSMLFELRDFANEICTASYKCLSNPVLICDKEKFIAVSGISKISFIGQDISTKLEKIIENRKDTIKIKKSNEETIALLYNDTNDYYSQIIVPIIAGGDTYGALVCFTKEQKIFGDTEHSVLKCMANFLAEQVD